MSESKHSESPEPAPVSEQQVREVEKHMKKYVQIGIVQAVMVLIAVIVAVNVSPSMQVLATLIVTAINGLVIALILMHLKEEKQTIWKFLIFTAIFFFILFFLTYLARTDLISQTFHNHH
jgi:FtsH-binding integral membrane protein